VWLEKYATESYYQLQLAKFARSLHTLRVSGEILQRFQVRLSCEFAKFLLKWTMYVKEVPLPAAGKISMLFTYSDSLAIFSNMFLGLIN
jgi:hypothetical protein